MAVSTIPTNHYQTSNTGNSTTNVTLPSWWQEALVKVNIAGSVQAFTIHVVAPSDNQYHINGGMSDTYSKSGADVQVSGNVIRLLSCFWYGQDRTSDTTFVVYYR